jgi:hypothetical protein
MSNMGVSMNLWSQNLFKKAARNALEVQNRGSKGVDLPWASAFERTYQNFNILIRSAETKNDLMISRLDEITNEQAYIAWKKVNQEGFADQYNLLLGKMHKFLGITRLKQNLSLFEEYEKAIKEGRNRQLGNKQKTSLDDSILSELAFSYHSLKRAFYDSGSHPSAARGKKQVEIFFNTYFSTQTTPLSESADLMKPRSVSDKLSIALYSLNRAAQECRCLKIGSNKELSGIFNAGIEFLEKLQTK